MHYQLEESKLKVDKDNFLHKEETMALQTKYEAIGTKASMVQINHNQMQGYNKFLEEWKLL
jgi:hypothetical protein